MLRRARIAVLESLYESESSNHDPEDVYERQMERAETEDPELAAEGPRGFGKGMLRGIWSRREELDRHIGEAAPQVPGLGDGGRRPQRSSSCNMGTGFR